MTSTLAQPRDPDLQPSRSRILIVDDDEAATAALVTALVARGHAVRRVETTWEALGQAAPFAPDAVVYDPFPRGTPVPRFADKVRAICASAGHARPSVYAASPEVPPTGYVARENVDAYVDAPVALEAILCSQP